MSKRFERILLASCVAVIIAITFQYADDIAKIIIYILDFFKYLL